jgi:signal transduction histidine kinase
MTAQAFFEPLLQPIDGDELRSRFRRVMAIAYLQDWTITLIVGVIIWALWPIATPLGPVVGVLMVLHAVNLAFLLSARRRAPRATDVAGKFAAAILLVTALIHFLGWTRSLLMLTPYVVVYVNAQLVLSTLGRFVFANATAALYALLLVAEHAGWLARHPALLFSPPESAAWAWIVGFATWASLNFAALHATLFPSMFEIRSAQLAAANARLAEQGRALAYANTILAGRARALEQKQAEVQAFTYTVTHDLRSPINNILLIGDLVLAREGSALSAEGRAEVERMVRLASGTEKMLRDLLDSFRTTSTPEPEAWVDLDTLVHEVVETLRGRLDAKQVRLTLHPLPRVWGQAQKLHHVFANLLDNAVKYVRPVAGEVTVSARVEDGAAIIGVRDDGIGIPPEYHEAIFRLFGRVPVVEQDVERAAVAGSGVGLASVKRIVELHGGTVWVESAPGAGSTFFIRLPIAEETPAAA